MALFQTHKITRPNVSGPYKDELVDAINVSSGTSADAGKVILTNASGTLDPSFGGGGGSININASPVTNPNFNNTTPVAPSGLNITWQVSGSNVSAYIPLFSNGSAGLVVNPGPSTSRFLRDDNTWQTVAQTFSAVAHQFLTSYSAATGLFTAAAIALGDLPGSGAITVSGTANHITITGSPVSLGGTVTVDLASPLSLPNLGAAILFNTDNAFDIGATGATRPRSLWIGTNITMQQPTAATAGANHSGGVLELDSTYWTGSASATDAWKLQNVVTSVQSNPPSKLNVTHTGSPVTASITNIAGDGTLATYSSTNDFSPGDIIKITGMTHTAFNGWFKIVAVTGSQFQCYNTTVQSSVADTGTATGTPAVFVPKLVSNDAIAAATRLVANQTPFYPTLAITNIASNTPSSGNVTVTVTPFEGQTAHQFAVGDTITISGTTNFNGNITVTSVTATTFVYALVSSAATETSGTATDITPTFDCSGSDSFIIKITANSVPIITNFVQDQVVSIAIVQDAVGGRTWTWPGNVINATNITSAAVSNSASVFTMLGAVDPINGGIKLYTTNTTGSSGGGLLPRNTALITTTSTAPNAVVSGSLPVAKSFLLLKVVCAFPTRVRLYETQGNRDTTPAGTSEPNRPNTIPPAPGTAHGVIADVFLDGVNAALTWKMSPVAPGTNNDTVPNSTIYYNVTNLDTVTRNLSVTLTFLQVES